MKKLLFLFIILAQTLTAQNMDWAPNGAEWFAGIYHPYSFGSGGGDGYYRYFYDRDTLVEGNDCQIIKVETTYRSYFPIYDSATYSSGIIDEYITYADADRVYIQMFDQFYTLFDFSAVQGDTLEIPGTKYYYAENTGSTSESYESCDTVGYIVVDSTGIININNQELRTYWVSPTENSAWSYNGQIIERIGNVSGHFLPIKNDYCGLVLDYLITNSTFRCYSDNDFQSYKNPNLQYPCDYLLSIPTHNLGQSGIRIYPNPTSGKTTFSIGFTPTNNSSIVITDLQGRTIKTLAITQKETQIDLDLVVDGIYLVHLVENGQIQATKKLVYAK